MRVVNYTKGSGGSRLELNFMWMPTFIAQNVYVMRELEQAWHKEFAGSPATEDMLEIIHTWTVRWLAEKFKIPGLISYLSAIKEIKEDDDGIHESSGQGVLLGSS